MAEREPEIRQRFCKILKKASELGLTADDIQHIGSFNTLEVSLQTSKKRWLSYVSKIWQFFLRHWIAVLILCTLHAAFWSGVFLADFPVEKRTVVKAWFYISDMEMEQEQCLIEATEAIVDFARPPVDCEMCEGITSVDRVSAIKPHDFENRYAYSGRPVVITDAMENWTAPKTFSFSFFQNVYSEDSPVLQNQERNCQFFPYKTNFDSLGEVFNMSDDRAQMKEGSEPWYIGWSNCDASATNVLRKHYDRPYFLPSVAESSRTDWIFMGSPGYGAHMHIDNVRNPSWQAQITGTKLWMLEPPPECYLSCQTRVEVIVHPGEIIVIDTNIWYHSTKIVSDDMSITIGSEYD